MKQETQEEKFKKLLINLTSGLSPFPTLDEREWFLFRVKLLQEGVRKNQRRKVALKQLNKAYGHLLLIETLRATRSKK